MADEYNAYTSFAQVYDLFMDNVPYEAWGDYIASRLREAGITDGVVLDLGCGTGKLTRIMAAKGYDMIGADSSIDMLSIAQQNTPQPPQGRQPILYLNQDMRQLELHGTVDAIYSACDCINYIPTEEELLEVFMRVCKYLDTKGLFLFDCNTPYKYETLLAENTFAENRPEGSFIWENYYNPDTRVNEYDLTLYIRQLQIDTMPRKTRGMGRKITTVPNREIYERFEETHFQCSYDTDTLQKLLAQAGLHVVGIYDGYTLNPPQDESERLVFVARRSL